MPATPVINLRKGHAVRHNNDVCVVTDTELKTPPRMASFVQMSVRSITIGKMYNLRMTSNESLESVNLVRDNHEFSYKDGDGYHFIHPETFEDVLIGEDKLDAKTRGYLIEGQKYLVVFADDVVAGIELPANIVMTITDSPAGVKGDSANNGVQGSHHGIRHARAGPSLHRPWRQDQHQDRRRHVSWPLELSELN